ncbi:uncharacterized protein LOC119334658 [Triticum dicoccoides]|uniref:uncharacterized protein LOC119334658 n=1 Tax=Triticum dicoccoides TaxID=85692 RepID=UPI000E7CF1C4|nr:uncharacterized protein LOC119334658 [Triticum dicoccoides]
MSPSGIPVVGSSISRCLALSGVLTTYGQRLAEFLAVHRLIPSEPQILELPTPPELPEDILMCIFASLETPDLVRAGSVCSSWRSACARLCNLGLFRQTQTPCLLYTSESAGESAAGLFSLVENKSYTLALPDPPIRTRYVIGSNHGWIITADDRSELHLLNPITGDQIALPSVTTIEQVKPIFDDAGALHKYQYSWYTGTPRLVDFPTPSVFSLGELRDYLFEKAFLSSDPSTGDYYVVLKHNPQSQLSFARAGDDRWTWLPPQVNYADCFFKDGLLFALDSRGEVRTFDLSAPVVTQNIVLGRMKAWIEDCNYMYIAQAPCGDLLQVWKSRNCLGWDDEDVSEHGLEDGEDEYISEHKLDDATDLSRLKPEDREDDDVLESELGSDSHVVFTDKFDVFKVDFAATKLEDITSSCDSVMFLGHNQSFCLSADEYPQLKSNHAYFTDEDDAYHHFGSMKSQRDIGVLNLGNCYVERIVSPQLWSNMPAPVWFIPNPRKIHLASHD